MNQKALSVVTTDRESSMSYFGERETPHAHPQPEHRRVRKRTKTKAEYDAEEEAAEADVEVDRKPRGRPPKGKLWDGATWVVAAANPQQAYADETSPRHNTVRPCARVYVRTRSCAYESIRKILDINTPCLNEPPRTTSHHPSTHSCTRTHSASAGSKWM